MSGMGLQMPFGEMMDSCGDGLKDAIGGVDRVRDSLARTCVPEKER